MSLKGARRSVWFGAVAVALGACTHAPARLGDTHVGKGQLFRAGRPSYDTFFEQTHQVQAQAIVALDEERRARSPVERALGGEPAPSATVLANRIVARERKRGPSATPRDAAFAEALDRSLAGESTITKKYDPIATRAAQLSVRADELLVSTAHDFARAREREEVTRELDAAKLVLQAAALRTRTVANDAQTFVNVATEARESVPRQEPAPAPAPLVRARTRTPPLNKGRVNRSAADARHVTPADAVAVPRAAPARPPHVAPAEGVRAAGSGPAAPSTAVAPRAAAAAARNPSDDFNP